MQEGELEVNSIKQKMYGVLDGNASPLKIYIVFKKIENQLKEAIQAVQEQAVEEARKYGSKSFSESGAIVSIRNAPGKWSYDHVFEWKELSDKVKTLEEQLKLSYKAKATLIHESSGEIVQSAHYRAGKEIIAISLKKDETNKENGE